MSLFDTILTSFALAFDAFTVAISKGIMIKNKKLKKSLIIGSCFGTFQLIMTLFGYLFGRIFYNYIVSFDHWIAFIFLSIIGINMFISSPNKVSNDIKFSEMLFLSIATSVDALVVGVALSLFKINIIFVIFTIGIITFLLSSIGVLFGNELSKRININSEKIGGIILVLLGIKILLEHLS